MKPGDVVYGKYDNLWGQCLIINITKVTIGYLWWKKTVEVALVEFREMRWRDYMGDWQIKGCKYVEIPVSKLRSGC